MGMALNGLPVKLYGASFRHSAELFEGQDSVTVERASYDLETRQAEKEYYDEIGFLEVVSRDLRVMDHTAVTFCRDNGIPILVFDLMKEGNIRAALVGERIGTLIR